MPGGTDCHVILMTVSCTNMCLETQEARSITLGSCIPVISIMTQMSTRLCGAHLTGKAVTIQQEYQQKDRIRVVWGLTQILLVCFKGKMMACSLLPVT